MEDELGPKGDVNATTGVATAEELAAVVPARQRGETHKARLIAWERARKAMELRKAGASYSQIAQQCGYSSPSGAYQAVKRVMARIEQESTNELRKTQYERLNQMLLVMWPRVQGGDEQAIGTALRIMDKMDRLMGTEAPTKVETTSTSAVLVIDGDSDAYIENLKRMAGAVMPELPKSNDQDDDILEAEVIEDTYDEFDDVNDDAGEAPIVITVQDDHYGE